jgi:hypothetical protein
MESEYELAQLFLRRHNLLFGQVSDFPVVNDIVDDLVQLLLRVFDVHNLL